MITPNAIASILNSSRQLWEGSDESPAVRQIATTFAHLLDNTAFGFDRNEFLAACGYESGDVQESPDSWTQEVVKLALDLIDSGVKLTWVPPKEMR